MTSQYIGYPPWAPTWHHVTPSTPTVHSEVIYTSRFIPLIARAHVINGQLHFRPQERSRGEMLDSSRTLRRFRAEGRGCYRIFNAACYRFYRSNERPPKTTDPPFATNATLPYSPSVSFADGTWYLSVSYFNGVLDSGFLPLGDNGETYLILRIVGGVQKYESPLGPNEWYLENVGAGVVRVHGYYRQRGGLRAGEWALAYTTDGSEPPIDTPDVTLTIAAEGLITFAYDLPAQSTGTIVKVRLQTRRNDGGTWTYSVDSEVKTITAIGAYIGDAAGPLEAYRWLGRLPEYL